MTINDLKNAMENKIPVIIDRSYHFYETPTIITDVQDHPLLGGLVLVKGGKESYEGYRVKLFTENDQRIFISNGR